MSELAAILNALLGRVPMDSRLRAYLRGDRPIAAEPVRRWPIILAGCAILAARDDLRPVAVVGPEGSAPALRNRIPGGTNQTQVFARRCRELGAQIMDQPMESAGRIRALETATWLARLLSFPDRAAAHSFGRAVVIGAIESQAIALRAIEPYLSGAPHLRELAAPYLAEGADLSSIPSAGALDICRGIALSVADPATAGSQSRSARQIVSILDGITNAELHGRRRAAIVAAVSQGLDLCLAVSTVRDPGWTRPMRPWDRAVAALALLERRDDLVANGSAARVYVERDSRLADVSETEVGPRATGMAQLIIDQPDLMTPAELRAQLFEAASAAAAADPLSPVGLGGLLDGISAWNLAVKALPSILQKAHDSDPGIDNLQRAVAYLRELAPRAADLRSRALPFLSNPAQIGRLPLKLWPEVACGAVLETLTTVLQASSLEVRVGATERAHTLLRRMVDHMWAIDRPPQEALNAIRTAAFYISTFRVLVPAGHLPDGAWNVPGLERAAQSLVMTRRSLRHDRATALPYLLDEQSLGDDRSLREAPPHDLEGIIIGSAFAAGRVAPSGGVIDPNRAGSVLATMLKLAFEGGTPQPRWIGLFREASLLLRALAPSLDPPMAQATRDVGMALDGDLNGRLGVDPPDDRPSPGPFGPEGPFGPGDSDGGGGGPPGGGHPAPPVPPPPHSGGKQVSLR